MTTNSFFFKDLEITHIIKPRLKNSYISISSEAEITLKTPKVSQSFIFSLLEEKENWIRKKINKVKMHPPIKVNLEDEVLLFGEIYSIDAPEALSLRKKLEKLKTSTPENIIKHYNSFYKNYAAEYISPKVQDFAKTMGLSYNTIKFRRMKSRWGSCSSSKVLTFNTELVKVKKELIDYVIVHELAHLTYMNHSKKFHDLVEKFYPDSKTYRKELKNIKISTF